MTDGVAEITEHAARTVTGREVEVDTIIFGTGFHSTEFLSPLQIAGREGLDLNEAWADGARAYLGVAVHGFPNLFLLYGPNTNLGHNSILFMIEQQVGYVRSLVADMMEADAVAADVAPAAMERYEREILAATERTVWAEDCHSWYKNDAGRVTNNWPDFSIRYRNRLRRRVPGDVNLERAPARATG